MSTVSQGPGGSALNTAWHLAAQGIPTNLYAAVGRDSMAQVLTHALREESKVVDAVNTLATLEREATASCVSMFGPRVDRTFMSTYGAAKIATVAQLLGGRGAGGVDALCDEGVTHVHVGGFYVCKGLHAGLPAAVKRLKSRGVKVSMDPNFDAAGEWTPVRVGTWLAHLPIYIVSTLGAQPRASCVAEWGKGGAGYWGWRRVNV